MGVRVINIPQPKLQIGSDGNGGAVLQLNAPGHPLHGSLVLRRVVALKLAAVLEGPPLCESSRITEPGEALGLDVVDVEGKRVLSARGPGVDGGISFPLAAARLVARQLRAVLAT